MPPRSDLDILAHQPQFVKRFFRGFSRNFHASLLSRILRFSREFYPNFIGFCIYLFAALSSAWIYYHTIPHLSTPFFFFFQISFQTQKRRPFGRRCRLSKGRRDCHVASLLAMTCSFGRSLIRPYSRRSRHRWSRLRRSRPPGRHGPHGPYRRRSRPSRRRRPRRSQAYPSGRSR